jgi:hypothetical protein
MAAADTRPVVGTIVITSQSVSHTTAVGASNEMDDLHATGGGTIPRVGRRGHGLNS